jgi:hypothetical protein
MIFFLLLHKIMENLGTTEMNGRNRIYSTTSSRSLWCLACFTREVLHTVHVVHLLVLSFHSKSRDTFSSSMQKFLNLQKKLIA